MSVFVTVKAEPPLNSIPKCKPETESAIADARINTPENAYQRRRLPMKSTDVSPRYKRPPKPENLDMVSYASLTDDGTAVGMIPKFLAERPESA
ncbi:unannotated protein [freshwater metagenome]|uniref:Unannotated protein n=1 Tax=freshwater metagenome TaxID=449393 RepID=A0A6J7ABH9_9ZZZZ